MNYFQLCMASLLAACSVSTGSTEALPATPYDVVQGTPAQNSDGLESVEAKNATFPATPAKNGSGNAVEANNATDDVTLARNARCSSGQCAAPEVATKETPFMTAPKTEEADEAEADEADKRPVRSRRRLFRRRR